MFDLYIAAHLLLLSYTALYIQGDPQEPDIFRMSSTQ